MTIAEIKKAQEALSKRKKCDFCVNRISDNDCINCKENVAVEITDLANMYDITFRTLRNELERLESRPLTLEQLRNMFGEPVWVKCEKCSWIPLGGYWCMITDNGILPPSGELQPFDCGWEFYKYKPTESEE